MGVNLDNILVGTDFSENADRALDFSLNLAGKLNASLTIVNFIPIISEIITAGSGRVTLPDNYLVEAKRLGEEAMAKTVKRVKDANPNLKVTSIVKIGSPVNEIIDMSEKYNYIIIGRSGENSWREAYMGTTSERIVNMAKCPVIVIR